jgi:uncharacterized membrane protein YeaQ/YmgE (transglycosylase-associated protein family)
MPTTPPVNETIHIAHDANGLDVIGFSLPFPRLLRVEWRRQIDDRVRPRARCRRPASLAPFARRAESPNIPEPSLSETIRPSTPPSHRRAFAGTRCPLGDHMILGILGWIVVGLIVGYIASKAVDLHGDDPKLGVGVAAAGALVSAGLYSLFSGSGVTAWNPWALLFAAIGATTGAVIWHGVRSRYVSRERYVPRKSY